ncbi:enoyl-CoA hydratase/isomerase family protein [Pandoraea pulmonicola]|uniref:Enoyl-CoA hydratase n=1 Tax=Pandoraea pulmonicola TaxID=93221 RepID=A0AAJ4ZBM3_PANPU|nr:enoyl-CoA hydratase/isomerase family protein [Pandoraea pulmonicola]APD13326.1 enoyl-CoA hydratase [Pandoraea pulmonicola]SUA90326.1 Probable enoyl-CoA hydratase echA8 [Pandoraea pulmonicola]
MKDWETLALVRHDGFAEIVLDRPRQRNALNAAMCDELRALVQALRDDASVRCVIVRANGPVFCAGADLKERQGMSLDDVRARRIKAFAAYDAIEQIGKPCIALVEGPAIGSGGEIAMACDFIVATEAAAFRTPEALWGTVGATQRMPRAVGKRLAKDMAFTGRTLSAQEALVAGLVSRIVPASEALDTVRAMARDIAAAPPLAMHLTKHCIDKGVETDAAGALAIEMLAIETLLQSPDWGSRIAGFGSDTANGQTSAGLPQGGRHG